MNRAIVCDGVTVRRGDRVVVHSVDLGVASGEWFGLIGANGSGKTSLLRGIAGRLPFDAGRCLVDGRDLGAARAPRAAAIGFAPPPDLLPDALTGRDVIELSAGSLAVALERIGPVGGALSIDSLLGQWIGDCSAGMRQRLAIALAFTGGQRLVVLDEPFNWLDPVAAYDLKQALRTMVDGGLMLMTALHDLATLATVCDRGAMLVDGRVARDLDAQTLAAAARNPIGFERETIDLLRSGAG